jgi:hypothetical protein
MAKRDITDEEIREEKSKEEVENKIAPEKLDEKVKIVRTSKDKEVVIDNKHKFYVDIYSGSKVIETHAFSSELIAEKYMNQKEKDQLRDKINIMRLHRVKDDKLIKEKRYIVK